MKLNRYFLLSVISCSLFLGNAHAAIQYNGTTSQSPYAATTTNTVGDLLNQAVTGGLGASSTSDVDGIVNGAKNGATKVNSWLGTNAGIDFFGILKAIGHALISVIGFVFDLIKKAL